MTMLASLLFYFFWFAISTFLVYAGVHRRNKVYTATGVLIPILIAVLRNNVGTDYLSYVKMFETLSSLSFTEYLQTSSIEVGFYVFAQVAAFLGGNHFLFLAIPAALTVLLYFRGIRKLSGGATWFVWLLYLLVIFPVNINQVRQGLAMSIALFAFTYLLRGRVIKSITILLVASLFHSSALLFIPVVILVHWASGQGARKMSRLRIQIVCLVSTIGIIAAGLLLGQLFGSGDKGALVKTGINILEQSQLLVYCALFFLLRTNKKVRDMPGRGVFLLTALVPILALTGIFLETYERLALFVVPILFLSLSYLVLDIRGKIMPKKQLLFWIILMISLMPISIMYVKSAYMEQPWIFPYHFMWENVEYIPHEKLV